MVVVGLLGVAAVGLSVFFGVFVLLGDIGSLTLPAGWLRHVVVRARAGPGSLSGDDVGRTHREQVMQDMPTFLDIVTLGLSAGLSFDASLELYCTRYESRLARLVSDALLSWRIGVASRAEALTRLAREADAAAMERFAATVADALAFGTPLSQALERQAQVIREEQRAEVEEEIERVPVKMLIPLGTLIVPAMLLAILGPLLGPALGLG